MDARPRQPEHSSPRTHDLPDDLRRRLLELVTSVYEALAAYTDDPGAYDGLLDWSVTGAPLAEAIGLLRAWGAER